MESPPQTSRMSVALLTVEPPASTSWRSKSNSSLVSFIVFPSISTVCAELSSLKAPRASSRLTSQRRRIARAARKLQHAERLHHEIVSAYLEAYRLLRLVVGIAHEDDGCAGVVAHHLGEREAAHPWKVDVHQVHSYAVPPGNAYRLFGCACVDVAYPYVVQRTPYLACVD